MLRANDFSEVLWDFLRQAKSNPDELVIIFEVASKESIILFYTEFERAVRNLRQSEIYRRLRPASSDDGLSDILAYIVGQGEAYYDEALAYPEKVPSQVNSDDVAFRGAASSVFWRRFNEEIAK